MSSPGLSSVPAKSEPIITDADFDSQNIVFWSESENCYVGYVRKYVGERKDTRSISRTSSPDFLTWTKPVIVEYVGRLEEQLYTNATLPYFRAPHLYVALPTRYTAGRLGEEKTDAPG